MCSRFLAGSTMMAMLLLSACQREQRQSSGQPLAETAPASVQLPSVLIAGSRPAPTDPRGRLYEGNAYFLNEGQRLFEQFNCTGCHAHGGGDIGPPLMDDEWRYGGQMDQIVASIAYGRPNGMPSFADKLTEQQMWQIAAYVRSMSGNVPKDVASSRADELASTPPLTRTPRQPIRGEAGGGLQGVAP